MNMRANKNRGTVNLRVCYTTKATATATTAALMMMRSKQINETEKKSFAVHRCQIILARNDDD